MYGYDSDYYYESDNDDHYDSSVKITRSNPDFYGSRFLALMLPLFMIAAFNVRYFNSIAIKSSYLLYMTLQFYYWL